MIKETPPGRSNAEPHKELGDEIFYLQRELSGGYGNPPSDTDARAIVEKAERLARQIESAGVIVGGSLKYDLSHFYNTAKGRGLADAAPTLKKLAGI